jgi:N-acyl-L-homoserine lactone synthetase
VGTTPPVPAAGPGRPQLFGTGDRPLRPAGRLRLAVADTAAEVAAAQALEAQVFLDSFDNTPDVMEQEYGHYADRSRYVVVLDDADGSAVGMMRLIVPDATGELKTLTDVAGPPWQLSVPDSLRSAGLADRPVWDVATLAVARRHRSGAGRGEVTLALCHGLYRYSRACGVEGWVTVLDDRVLRLLRMLGVPWTAMPGAGSEYYLGSPASTPCVCLLDAIPPNMRARRPDVAPAMLDGDLRSISAHPADLHPGRGVRATRVP